MPKKDNIKIFIDEIYSKPPKKKYETNKIINNRFDGIRINDWADMIEYKTSNNKGYRSIFLIIDNCSKYLWTIPLKTKNSKTVAEAFSNILSKSKRFPIKLESDRGKKWYNSSFQYFLKNKTIHRNSRLADKRPSIAGRVIRTERNLLKKPVFEKGNADWLSELQSVIKN